MSMTMGIRWREQRNVCACNSHTLNKFVSQKHNNGTLLHNVEEIEEVKYEMNNEVSTGVATKHVIFAATLKIYCSHDLTSKI